mmetsp:Transcript_6779/g.7402  ORF Transcript_6779/g.7402 Transcript_6779/m.7402 type:complete len:84 (-) Transcript_6779:320-571(-)
MQFKQNLQSQWLMRPYKAYGAGSMQIPHSFPSKEGFFAEDSFIASLDDESVFGCKFLHLSPNLQQSARKKGQITGVVSAVREL